MFNVYKITNLINNKMYIGVTERSLLERFKQHSYNSNKTALGNAMIKYGINNFQIDLLEETTNREEMFRKEIYYIELYDTYKSGYNMTLGGEGSKTVEVPDNLVVETYLLYKSSDKTAKTLNISGNSVLRILKANNIKLFGSGPENSKRVSSEEVVKQYSQNNSITTTAKILGINRSTVHRKLQEVEVPTDGYRLGTELESEIVKQYIQNQQSVIDISRIYGINRKTISRILKIHGVLVEANRTGKKITAIFSEGNQKEFVSQSECAKYLIKQKLVPQTCKKYVAEKIGVAIKNNNEYNNILFIRS